MSAVPLGRGLLEWR